MAEQFFLTEHRDSSTFFFVFANAELLRDWENANDDK